MNGSYQFEQLEGREREADFLAERAKLRLDGFKDLLVRHGMPSEGCALEVGCGHGIRTRLMAQDFPGVTITGVDRSHELLAEAQTIPSRINFVEANLYELPFPDASFDFVYSRLVFMHLTDAVSAMKEIIRVLRPGGKLLIEDADRDCMFFEPRSPAIASFWEKVQEGQRRLGGDPNVGRKLASLMKAQELINVTSEVQPIIGGGEDIAFLARTLMPSLNIYLPSDERSQGEAAIKELFELAKKPEATFYHFWFVVSGEKST